MERGGRAQLPWPRAATNVTESTISIDSTDTLAYLGCPSASLQAPRSPCLDHMVTFLETKLTLWPQLHIGCPFFLGLAGLGWLLLDLYPLWHKPSSSQHYTV